MRDSVHLKSLPSRRKFVALSAAALASTSLPASILLPSITTTSGAPRGKERDLLTRVFSHETIKSSLISLAAYRPFPTIGDRAGWNALRSETRSALLRDGEKYLRFHWPEMPATLFLVY